MGRTRTHPQKSRLTSTPKGDKIDLMNKVGSEMRDILEQLTKTGIPVPDQLRDKLDKYHQIDVIDVDIETQRGYFDYVFENMDTFRRGKALGRKHLSDTTVAISRTRQLDLELEQQSTSNWNSN